MPTRHPLEADTRTLINVRLQNLGWILDQRNPNCNVFQEQAKTDAQNKKLKGKRPDYVLYEENTDRPIAVIEAKRPGESMDDAMVQVVNRYAKPLNAPLAFTFNGTFVVAYHLTQNRPLKIDGAELQDFIDQATATRFINEGAEILSAPKGIEFSREELIGIFKHVNKLLRQDGLRDGFERFSAFSEILFLKLTDEVSKISGGVGHDKRFLWGNFIKKYKDDDIGLKDFIRDSVWKEMKKQYGDIFDGNFNINQPHILREIINQIDPINLTAMDTDVKGDAFEYFLKTVTNGNKDLGEYFTPRHIVRTMVNMVKPRYGETVYDPFCGTGGFLLDAFKYLLARTDPSDDKLIQDIKSKALFGREITSTSRIAKMNMILFGDGHNNIEQCDSLKYPVNNRYNIVLSNIPYSQKTEFGSLYPIPTDNADSVCMQHIWQSLKEGGRGAVIVPESFLYEGGVIGQTREMIIKGSSKFDVISLPRGVFNPYTPTKTNILFFEKGENLESVFFFVIHNDGFELNTARKPIDGDSDIKTLLSEIEAPRNIKAKANVVDRETIKSSGNWNLRPFYYMEDIPEATDELVSLQENILEEVTEKVNPQDAPDDEWINIQVSQNGIFLNDIFKGSEATQKYKRVRAGDIVYNPYRVNIGSIGIVPSYLDGALVSPAYVVARTINSKYSAAYIVAILKHPRYLQVIMNYSLSSARANLPFSELMRIKIPKPSKKDSTFLKKSELEIKKNQDEADRLRTRLLQFVGKKIKYN